MTENIFSNDDYLQLTIIFGECNKVLQRTCDIFRERFPHRPTPNVRMLKKLLNNLATSGSFKPKVARRAILSESERNISLVLGYFSAYPTASLNDAERDIGMNRTLIFRILKKQGFKAYKFYLVQNLKEGDYERRINFCEWLIIRSQEDEHFLENIIWSDESKFCKNGLFNRHNSHYWNNENTHQLRPTNFQENWSFNCYCAIKNSRIICVKFYDENLNGKHNELFICLIKYSYF